MKIKDLHKKRVSIVTDEYLVLRCNSCNKVWLVEKPQDDKISPRDWHCLFNYCNEPQAKKYHEKEMEMLKQIAKEAEENGVDIEPF